MSTDKPRITVTLEPKTAVQLKRLAQLTGNSQSSLVSEVLEQAFPVFDRMIQVLEAAVIAKESVRTESVKRLEEAQRRVEEQLGLALGEFTQATDLLVVDGESKGVFAGGPAPAGGPAKTVARPRATPLSNRGVRSTPDVTKIKPKRGRNAQV